MNWLRMPKQEVRKDRPCKKNDRLFGVLEQSLQVKESVTQQQFANLVQSKKYQGDLYDI